MQTTWLALYGDPLNSGERGSAWQKVLHTLRDKWDPFSYISSLLGSPGLLAESQRLLAGVSPFKCDRQTQGGLWTLKGRVRSDSTGNKDWIHCALTASCLPKMPTLLKCDPDFPDPSRDCQTRPLPWDQARPTRGLQILLCRFFKPTHWHSQCHHTALMMVFPHHDPLARSPLLSLVCGAARTVLKEDDLLGCPLTPPPSQTGPLRGSKGTHLSIASPLVGSKMASCQRLPRTSAKRKDNK